jgi:hypothetical protein
MASSHNFNAAYASFSHLVAGTEEKKGEIVRALALTTLSDLQFLSPVDTGRYRSSHDLTIDRASDFHPVDPVVPDGEKPKYSPAAAGSQLAVGDQRLRAVKRLPPRLRIYISTNVVYANALEHGHSMQAPAGVYWIARIRAKHRIEAMGGRFS